jgi:two-component system, OmpR family, phosphate regulon sensor histidine kinase PhoR
VSGLIHTVRRRIATKLAITLVGFVAIALLGAGLYLNQALESFAIQALEGRLVTAARLLHDDARRLFTREATEEELRAFARRASEPTDSRVTLIAADGRVLADSGVRPEDLPLVENHAGRPEVRAALSGRPGHDVRTSVTVHESLFYVGLPVTEGGRVVGVLRLALPLSVVTASYATLHRVLLLGALVALALAFGIAIFVAGRITQPVVEMQRVAGRMSEGDFSARAPVRSVDEIGTLARALNAMASGLRAKIADLENERAKITAILDGMVEGVLAVDGHERILLMNERGREMFDLARDTGDGRPFLEVIRNTDVLAIFRQARATGGAVLGRELQRLGPDGRIVRVNAVPFRLGSEERGIVIVVHDVTELRRLEQVRTEFVANVSHELRTPLTAILGYVETLLGGAIDEPEQTRKFLEVVFRHSERLGRLVNDLTDLSNIELGRVSLKLEPMSFDEVTESVLTIFRPRAEHARLALDARIDAGARAVVADRDRLAQILINLVDNAVKYTSAGGRVSVGARTVPSGMVEVTVADTGVGIPPGDLARVTERFYRVDRARSRELGGTGLGLAIVKHLVAAHGGELRIESVVGRGTSVIFTLPSGA